MTFLKLIRYKNLFMVLLTMILTKYALIESFIINSNLSNLEFILLCLSVLLITSGGYIINDIYDVKTDKINKPNKVFVGNTITIKNAWKSFLALTFSGLIIGSYLSIFKHTPTHILVFIITILGLFFYSKKIKKIPFFGNLIISLCIGLTLFIVLLFEYPKRLNSMQWSEFIYGELIVYAYILFSFIATLIREIIKDIEDIDGDLKINAKTLPIIFGRKRASKIAFFFSCILLFFLLIVLQFLKNSYLSLGYGIVFLLLPLLYFMYLLWFAKTKENFSKLSFLMKTIMLFGILSMLLFKLQ